MAFEDWERRPNGDIKVSPLMGYDAFRPFGMMCGLRLHYADDDGQVLAQTPSYLPLIMTVPQARELAAALNRLADTAETPPDDETAQ